MLTVELGLKRKLREKIRKINNNKDMGQSRSLELEEILKMFLPYMVWEPFW